MYVRRVGIGLLLLFCLTNLQAQRQNPFVGTWKLNPSKSKFGASPRILQTTIIKESGGGLTSTSEFVYENGQSVKTEWTATLDGTPAEMSGDVHYDTIILKKVDDRTLEVLSQKGPKVGRTSRWAVSSNGKTMTRTQKVVSEDGESVENVIAFDKQ